MPGPVAWAAACYRWLRGVPERGCQGRSGKGPHLLAECPQQSLVSQVSAGNLAEMRAMMPDGPVVQRVRAVTGLEDCGQAAPATVNHVAFRVKGKAARSRPDRAAELSRSNDRSPPSMGHLALKRAIRHAEANDLVARNVAALADTPKGQEGRPSKSLTLDQAVAVITAARTLPVMELRPGLKDARRPATLMHAYIDNGTPVPKTPHPPASSIWLTRDGGASWTKQSIPPGVACDGDCQSGLYGYPLEWVSCLSSGLCRAGGGDLVDCGHCGFAYAVLVTRGPGQPWICAQSTVMCAGVAPDAADCPTSTGCYGVQSTNPFGGPNRGVNVYQSSDGGAGWDQIGPQLGWSADLVREPDEPPRRQHRGDRPAGRTRLHPDNRGRLPPGTATGDHDGRRDHQ